MWDATMSVRNQASKAVQPPLSARVSRFIREARAELRKVVWPNRKELVTYTIVTLVTVAIVAVFLGLVDLIVYQLLALVGRLGR